MTDGPVLGQVGFPRGKRTLKIEIVGELKPREWQEFVECIRDCAKKFPGKIRVVAKEYKVAMKSIKKMNWPPKKKAPAKKRA